MKCFYCLKRAVRRGLCSRTKAVGMLPVCGRHFHCVDQPNQNIGNEVAV